MVLNFLSIQADQVELARQLGVKAGVGAPASRIVRLATDDIVIKYEVGEWATVQPVLAQNVPLIAMIQAGELPHWRGESFQHAVIIIGYDATQVWLLDPAVTSPDAIMVSIDEFMLAWGEMDYRYAVISKRA